MSCTHLTADRVIILLLLFLKILFYSFLERGEEKVSCCLCLAQGYLAGATSWWLPVLGLEVPRSVYAMKQGQLPLVTGLGPLSK